MEAVRIGSIRELHEAWENLEALLASSQPPGIGILLQQRFLEACLCFDGPVWTAYGFPAGVRLLARIKPPHVGAIPTPQLQGLAEVLARIRERPVPPLHGASTWTEDLGRAAQLAEESLEARRIGARPSYEQAALAPNRAGIAIPVVVELKNSRNVHPLYAGLRYGFLARLDVGVEFIGRSTADEVQVIDGDASSETRAAFAEAIARVDHFAAWGAPAAHRCLFRVRFSPAGARLRGRSASLGFMLAATAARSSHGLGSSYRSIPEGTAATGDIAGTRVLPVEASSLGLKIAACIDGAMDRLVVPEAQKEEAKALVASHPRHTSREPLEIIGTADVRELWKSPRGVLRRTHRSPREMVAHWIDRLARSRARVIMGVVSLGLLATMVIILSALRNAPPVRADWVGDTLVLKNDHGIATRRIRFAFAPQGAQNKDLNAEHMRRIIDLNGDGKRDVIAIHGSGPERRDSLTAVSVSGRVLWRTRSDHMAPGQGILPGEMNYWLIAAAPNQAGRTNLWMLSRSKAGSLSIITQLDPATGRVLEVLGNDGHLEDCCQVILPGTEKRVLALGGTDRPHARGLTAFIDPDYKGAIDPTSGGPEIPSLSDSTSLSRGVLAAWSVATDLYTRPGRTTCDRVSQDRDGTIQLYAIAYHFPGYLVYEFDPHDLRTPVLLRVYFTDAAKDVIRRDFGTVPDEDFAQEANRLAREVRVLTPEGWRPARLGPDILPVSDPEGSRESVREQR